MELAVIKNCELKSKVLVSKFNTINKVIESIGENNWTVAEKISEIVTPNEKGEYIYQNDFENIKELSAYLGVSPSYISNCKKAVDLNKSLLLKHDGYTVSQAYELSRACDVSAFMIQYSITKDDSSKTIREYVKKFNKEKNKSETYVERTEPYIDMPCKNDDDFLKKNKDKANKERVKNWNKAHPEKQFSYSDFEITEIKQYNLAIDDINIYVSEECYFAIRDTLASFNYL